MPAIALKNVAAGTSNAVDGLKFGVIPPGGAQLTIYGTTAVAGGNIDVSVESEDFAKSAALNIEASADVVDTDRDMVLDREPVPSGQLFLAVNDQICNLLIQLTY